MALRYNDKRDWEPSLVQRDMDEKFPLRKKFAQQYYDCHLNDQDVREKLNIIIRQLDREGINFSDSLISESTDTTPALPRFNSNSMHMVRDPSIFDSSQVVWITVIVPIPDDRDQIQLSRTTYFLSDACYNGRFVDWNRFTRYCGHDPNQSEMLGWFNPQITKDGLGSITRIEDEGMADVALKVLSNATTPSGELPNQIQLFRASSWDALEMVPGSEINKKSVITQTRDPIRIPSRSLEARHKATSDQRRCEREKKLNAESEREYSLEDRYMDGLRESSLACIIASNKSIENSRHYRKAE